MNPAKKPVVCPVVATIQTRRITVRSTIVRTHEARRQLGDAAAVFRYSAGACHGTRVGQGRGSRGPGEAGGREREHGRLRGQMEAYCDAPHEKTDEPLVEERAMEQAARAAVSGMHRL